MLDFINSFFSQFLVLTVLSVATLFLALYLREDDESEEEVNNKPTLIYQKGRFLNQNLKKSDLNEEAIRKILMAYHMPELKEIDSIIMEGSGKFLVFPQQEEKKSNYINGIALAA